MVVRPMAVVIQALMPALLLGGVVPKYMAGAKA
jgi:hypothetical protein